MVSLIVIDMVIALGVCGEVEARAGLCRLRGDGGLEASGEGLLGSCRPAATLAGVTLFLGDAVVKSSPASSCLVAS
jgi:hypothetical protein